MKTRPIAIAAAVAAQAAVAAFSNSDFGPGNSSDFAISQTERGYVVGVYGLSSANFVKRADGFRAFSDARIVDIEKHSGAEAADHSMCSDYSDLVCFFWGGHTDGWGYSSEDELAGAYLDGSAESAVDALYDSIRWKEIDYGASFAANLAAEMQNADGLMYMAVAFDDYDWYGIRHETIYHAVVCCGYSYDTNTSSSNPSWLTGLFIIDPDNDRETKGGGAAAPDTITYCPVKWDSGKGRYEIRGIFGASGYLDEEEAYGDMLRAKTAPARRAFIENKTNPDSQGQTGAETSLEAIRRIFAKARLEKTYFTKSHGDYDSSTDGLAAVKISKANKKGQVKIMVKLTPFFGSAKTASKIVFPDGEGWIETTIDIPGFGTFDFYAEVYEEENGFFFDASNDDCEFRETTLGGSFSEDLLYFSSDVNDIPQFPGRSVVEGLLPSYYVFSVWGGSQWIFPRRPQLGWTRATSGANIVTTFSSGWSLAADTTLLGDNYCGLTLKYNPSSGIFQGSYRVFYTNADFTDSKPKAKAVKALVRGVVVNYDEDDYTNEETHGRGLAAVKINGKIYTWPVRIGIEGSNDWDDYDDDDWGFDDDLGL